MGRILLVLVLAILFIALAALSIYLTYQAAAVFFANQTFAYVAAGLLFLFGALFVFKDLLSR